MYTSNSLLKMKLSDMIIHTDFNGNTALWEAIAAKHHSIFKILYHWACISDPYLAGDLLCTAASRNDLAVMKELLKHGLYVDSKDRHGLTAIQVATTEKHIEMLQLLLMNGSEVNETVENMINSSVNLNEMLQKREVGHRIVVSDTPSHDVLRVDEIETRRSDGRVVSRVSIYRGHPMNRRVSQCAEPGKLIRTPDSLVELKSIAGELYIFILHNKLLILFS